MTTEKTNAYIEAAAAALDLEIRPEWKANVAQFFDVAKAMAETVTGGGALSEGESAPIFTLRDVE